MKPIILGIDDSINTCDCCGKSKLKSTVIVEVNSEIFHYGSTCASRNTGLDVKAGLKLAKLQNESDARKEWLDSPIRQARETAVANRPANFYGAWAKDEWDAARDERTRIKLKYNVPKLILM